MAAIEGRGFHRLGDPEVRHSRFRLISATNRTLAELCGGLLDRDFLDRLAVFIVEVPPLRDCADDLPELWASVLRRAALAESVDQARWRPFAADPSLLSALRGHPLPGNLRDLQRVAYHLLAALAADEPHDRCAAQALTTLADTATAAPQNPDIRLPIADLRRHLDLYRQRWIDAAMHASGGDQSAAARLLGVPRATLRDWLSGEPATEPSLRRP
jgi:DNA-binding NtrC family response regulator